MAIYKRNNKWYCRGRVEGERYHKLCDGAKTKEEAKSIDDAERFKIRQEHRGLREEIKDFTMNFMMEKYLETRIANNTNISNAKTYKKYILEYFGKNRKILSVKPIDIENFKIFMLNKNIAKGTVNRYLIALKRAYNIMINNELIKSNPVKKVNMLIEDNKRYRYLNKDEWIKLQNVLDNKIIQIVKVALLSGLRKKNVLNLNKNNINFELKIIEILKQDNKGKKILRIPMSNALIEILKNIKPNKNGYYFVNPKTNMPYTDIRKSFNNALKKADINDFKFHDLRRTVGTWLLESGVDIRTIQNLLGHSEVSTTERYLAITPESNRKAMDILDNYML